MNELIETALESAKSIRLSDSELRNASTSYDNDKSYTIIRRAQPNGKYLVAAVDIDTRKIITAEVSDTREGCRKAVHDVNRWMDKVFFESGPMSHKSRRRQKKY